MGWVLIQHARIGAEVRSPGYVLSDEDLLGRDIRSMERSRIVQFKDDPAPSVRRARKSGREDDE